MKRTAIRRSTKPMKRWSKKPIPDKVLDDLCRDIVFWRDDYTCVRCQKRCEIHITEKGRRTYPGFHWSHVFGRGRKSMQWIIANAMCQCLKCHARWHDERFAPLEKEWFSKTYPERWEWLKMRAASRGNKIDREAILLDLRTQWMTIQAGATP